MAASDTPISIPGNVGSEIQGSKDHWGLVVDWELSSSLRQGILPDSD